MEASKEHRMNHVSDRGCVDIRYLLLVSEAVIQIHV